VSAFKLWVRIIAAVVATFGFVSSCGQLLGGIEVEQLSNRAGGPDAEAPRDIVCNVGETRCDGRLLQLCSDEGTAWATLEACASAELCQSSDVSTVSSCIAPACSAEQMSCDGNLLRLCNVSRTGWELFATCESVAHCDAGNRQCLPAPCEPGMRRCNVGNLERCNDDSTGWDLLDTCVTNELCEGTLSPPPAAGEALSGGDVPTPPTVSIADGGPSQCAPPSCVPRQVQCDATLLVACNEGQTDFEPAEDCATPKLCDASISYTGLRGAPRCVRATCAAGEHRCSDTGVLEVCNADRDGYDPLEACIGAPFCNAVAADNGLPGCLQAPCEADDQQCNGPQIQRCLSDRTGFENLGAACETRGLCNDQNPTAFCAAPACQRGALTGTEFRCDGVTLSRCNDQLTGYDPISSCATPGLCNAGLGFNGCQPPVCAPGETRCNGNFVQRCNQDRTAFENIEQCAAGTCDSFRGACTDPCVVGSARCNAQGNLEECRNPLIGREITARCGSVQLCDANARSCRTPPAGCTADGVRVCQSNVLAVCADGRSHFNTLDACAPGEVCDVNDVQCDVCVQGSEATCDNGQLVSCALNGQSELPQACPFGCQSVATGPDRCRTCTPGSFRCEGDQLVVCRPRGTEEFLERESCASAAICQTTIAACGTNGSGENCRCQPGVCNAGQRDCQGNQPVVCNADRTAFVPDGSDCGPGNCDPRPVGECFACGARDVQCGTDSIMEGCLSDRSGFADLPGARPRDVRCIEDNGGVRAQSCDGDSLASIACTSGLCVPGVGCAQCNPDDFDPECATTDDGRPARTVCINGRDDGPPVACAGTNGCVVAICDDGDCNTDSAPENTPCTRTGGGAGKCDGGGSCLECFANADCDDGFTCTDDVCAGGTCRHDPVSSRCDNGLFCDGTETCNPATGAAGTGCATGTRVVCNDDQACTTDTCTGTPGACTFAPVATPAPCTLPGPMGGSGTCGGGTCNAPVCNPGQCSQQNNASTCTTNTCVNNVCTPSSCTGGTLCNGEGTCVECLDDNGCDGDQVCGDGNTCVDPAPACNNSNCTGSNPLACTIKACVNDVCVDQNQCGDATPICNGAGLCTAPVPVCSPANCSGTNPATCTAKACVGNDCVDQNQCGGATPICNGAGLCTAPVAVCSPANCSGSNPATCTAKACVGNDCVDQNQCGGATPICNGAGLCTAPVAVCSPVNCSGSNPAACTAKACVGNDCVDQNQCGGATPICNGAGVCGAPAPACNTTNCTGSDPVACTVRACVNDTCIDQDQCGNGTVCNGNGGCDVPMMTPAGGNDGNDDTQGGDGNGGTGAAGAGNETNPPGAAGDGTNSSGAGGVGDTSGGNEAGAADDSGN
jgi:hypothetical protein